MIFVIIAALIEAAGGAIAIHKDVIEAVELDGKRLAMTVLDERLVLTMEEDENEPEIQETTP